MKAIVIPYVIDQNEPSIPLKKIVDVPSDTEARDAFLRDLFVEVFHFEEIDREEYELFIEENGACGDLAIGTEGGLYLFLTFVDFNPDLGYDIPINWRK